LTATSAQKNSPEFSSCKFFLNPPAAELLGPMKGGKPQQIKNKKKQKKKKNKKKGSKVFRKKGKRRVVSSCYRTAHQPQTHMC